MRPWPRSLYRFNRRSSRCSRRPRARSPKATPGSTSRSGTAFARSCSALAIELFIQSRELKPLDRYFPELAAPLRANLPDRCVLDGEIVIANGEALDFEALLLRIHPAASRVNMLAEQHPASFVAWDLLALGDADLRALPQAERRAQLERELAGAQPPIHVTPVTRDRAIAADWFERFEGAGLDGVIAKPLDLAYLPGKRAMTKIKHQRTAECAVAGFRWYKGGKGTLVGSLLLGLYDAAGVLHHVGVSSAFKQEVRAQLAELLAPMREGAKRRPPVERLGRVARSRDRSPPARRDESMESRQGPVVGTDPARVGRRGLLRPPRRARGSATRPTSSAGGRTSRPPSAATIS